MTNKKCPQKCPNSNKQPASAENTPFCSKRCADVDLARWFRGDYAVPTNEPTSEKLCEESYTLEKNDEKYPF